MYLAASDKHGGRAMDGRQRPWWLWALAGLVALAALAAVILAIWKLPSLLYGDVSKASPDARLQAASGFRPALVAGLAGLAALGSLAIATRTYRLTQQGQITDRYTKAIEQLGSDNTEVRLGGIYALERIAHDSSQDRATITEVLTAFVRGHAPWPVSRAGQPRQDMALVDLPELRTWAPDVQAALTVLGRRKSPVVEPYEPQALDLANTDLRRANLRDADLRGTTFDFSRMVAADLTGARLQEAILFGAVLQHAHLSEAELKGARLDHAHMQQAHLYLAQLQEAQLVSASLQEANLIMTGLQKAALVKVDLSRANLGEAQLQGANLRRANLQGAQLQDADLSDAQLQKADLRGAQLQGANLAGAQLEGAQCSADTVWPDGFDWKAAGVHQDE
jgi:uncharacterized protein YjbI with pentapeptide repeats